MGTVFLGIDPGQTGAVCVLDAGANTVKFYDAPLLEMKVGGKFKHVLDGYEMVRILKDATAGRQVMVTIERVGPMPGQGVTSMFNFGMGYGMWLGILAALELPYQTVHPATWKARCMAGCPKEKDASRAVAMQHYPHAAKELARKKDGGRADSALIARWGWLTYGGQPAKPKGDGLFD